MKALHLLYGAVAVSCIYAAPVFAQAPGAAASAQDTSAQALRDEIARLRQEFDQRLTSLEQRLATIEGGAAAAPSAPGASAAAPPNVAVPVGAQGAGGPEGALPNYGGAAAASKVFNPDMAVIGNFVGAAGKNTVRPEPSLAMREAETSFQAVVDPYARADFFMSFGEEGVNLEEGYLTFSALPGGLLMKVGKMRAAFGKVNTFHSHIMPWPDRPLVTQNLVGGEDGIDDAGFSVARLVPNRWVFLEATGQVFRGDSADLFSANQRSDLSYVGHLRGYHDLSENTNIDLGVSVSHGHNASGVVAGTDLGRFTTNLYGFDATVRWRPLQRSIYHSFIGRSEVIWSRRDQPDGLQAASGLYVSGDYQVGRRWFTGLRFDWSDRATDASMQDTGQSLTVTYWPSEFSQVRGQLRRTHYAEGPVANEFLFQFQFSIGAHGAHPF